MAQTTQFTAPGWQYLDSSSGYLGGNRNNGSYVSLKSPNGSDYSTIIETMDATAAQTLTFTVTGGLSTGHRARVVHQRAVQQPRRLLRAQRRPHAVRRQLLADRAARPRLQLTTTTGQGKGTATSPAPGTLALPYSDSFDGYPVGRRGEVPDGHAGRVRGRGLRRRPVRPVRPADVGAGPDLLDLPAPNRTRCSAT